MEFQKNKPMVAIVIVLLLLLVAAVFFYNRTLNDLAAGSCSDVNGPECPHAKIVETQNSIIAVLAAVIIVIVGYLAYETYGKKEEREEARTETVQQQSRKAAKKIDVSSLDPDEKKVVAIIQEKGGSAFQSDVIKGTGYTKVKISRLLDRLEQKGIVERKRRGMANLVVLK